MEEQADVYSGRGHVIQLRDTSHPDIRYVLVSFDEGLSWQWVGDMWPTRFVAQHGYHGLLVGDQDALLEHLSEVFPEHEEPVIVPQLTPEQIEEIRERQER